MIAQQNQCPRCGAVLSFETENLDGTVRCLSCQPEPDSGNGSGEEDVPEATKVEPPPLPPRQGSRWIHPQKMEESFVIHERRQNGSSVLPFLTAIAALTAMLVFAVGVVFAYRFLTRVEAPIADKRETPTRYDFQPPRVETERPNRPEALPPAERFPDPPEVIAELAEARKVLLTKGSTDDYVKQLAEDRLESWRENAAKGSAGAQWLLARYLDQDDDGDKKEVAELFRKSAEQGLDLAQNSLALAYKAGEGVDKDEKEAIAWLEKAVKQGFPAAMFNLGDIYVSHDSAEDERRGVQWLKKAADAGYVDADEKLGECYENGWGVRKDDAEAIKLYTRASERGAEGATMRLLVIYEDGLGVEKDLAEAKRMRERGRMQGGSDFEERFSHYSVVRNPIGKQAPRSEGMIEKKPFNLTDFRGKVVVLKFGATWCPPCRRMIPHKNKMVKRLSGEPFAYLDVDIDENKKLSEKWQISSVPKVYVLDGDGVIRFEGVFDEEMDEAVDGLLQKLKSKK